MLGTPPDDWHLFSDWADDIFKIFDWNVVNDEPDILRAWRALEDYLDDMVTRNQLAAAVQVFCDHPDQWALLRERPELAMKAVEEAMRYSPIIFTTMRVAVEDVELAGVTIRAGTLVIANTTAANRDPAVYRDPDRFDITREDAPAMLTFGGGIRPTCAPPVPSPGSRSRHQWTSEPGGRVHNSPLSRSHHDRPSGS